MVIIVEFVLVAAMVVGMIHLRLKLGVHPAEALGQHLAGPHE